MIPPDVVAILDQRVSYHFLAPFLDRGKHPLLVMHTSEYKYCFNYYVYGTCFGSCTGGQQLVHVSNEQVAVIRASSATYKTLQSWAREHYNNRENEKKKIEEHAKQQMVVAEQRRITREEELRIAETKRIEEAALRQAKREEQLRVENRLRAEKEAVQLQTNLTFLQSEPRRLYAQSHNMYDVARVCVHEEKVAPWQRRDCFSKIRFAQGSRGGLGRRRWICHCCFPTVISLSPHLFDVDTLFSKTYLSRLEPKITEEWVRRRDGLGNPMRCHKDCCDDERCYIEWEHRKTDENAKCKPYRDLVHSIMKIAKEQNAIREHAKEHLYNQCLLPHELCTLIIDY